MSKKYQQNKSSEDSEALIERAAEELARIFIMQIEEEQRKKEERKPSK